MLVIGVQNNLVGQQNESPIVCIIERQISKSK